MLFMKAMCAQMYVQKGLLFLITPAPSLFRSAHFHLHLGDTGPYVIRLMPLALLIYAQICVVGVAHGMSLHVCLARCLGSISSVAFVVGAMAAAP